MFLNGTIRFVVAYFNGLGVQIRKRQLSNTTYRSRFKSSKTCLVDEPLEKSDKSVDFKRTHTNIFTIAQDTIWSGEKH